MTSCERLMYVQFTSCVQWVGTNRLTELYYKWKQAQKNTTQKKFENYLATAQALLVCYFQ